MDTAICTCIKDELDYLKEWIEYHLDKGFNHIYLYEDYGSKSHKDIVNLFPNNVTLLPIDIVKSEPVKYKQLKMYIYSMKTLKNKYDWIAFIDIDEFIDFDTNYNLDKLLKEYNDYPAVMLSWMLYGANGNIKKPKGNVVDSYLIPNIDVNYIDIWHSIECTLKCIVNTKNYKGFDNVHYAIGAINTKNSFYKELKVFEKAWIRHYYTKSWEEWVWSIEERGNLHHGCRLFYNFFDANPDMVHIAGKLINNNYD